MFNINSIKKALNALLKLFKKRRWGEND